MKQLVALSVLAGMWLAAPAFAEETPPPDAPPAINELVTETPPSSDVETP